MLWMPYYTYSQRSFDVKKHFNIRNLISEIKIYRTGGFPGGAVVESLPANAGGTGSSPGLGGSHMPRSN